MARKYDDKQRIAWNKWYHNLDPEERKRYNRERYLRRKRKLEEKKIPAFTELSVESHCLRYSEE